MIFSIFGSHRYQATIGSLHVRAFFEISVFRSCYLHLAVVVIAGTKGLAKYARVGSHLLRAAFYHFATLVARTRYYRLDNNFAHSCHVHSFRLRVGLRQLQHSAMVIVFRCWRYMHVKQNDKSRVDMPLLSSNGTSRMDEQTLLLKERHADPVKVSPHMTTARDTMQRRKQPRNQGWIDRSDEETAGMQAFLDVEMEKLREMCSQSASEQNLNLVEN